MLYSKFKAPLNQVNVETDGVAGMYGAATARAHFVPKADECEEKFSLIFVEAYDYLRENVKKNEGCFVGE